MQASVASSRGSENVARVALAYFVLYSIGDALAVWHAVDGVDFKLWNAAPAMSLALLVRFGIRWWPAVFAAPLAAGFLHGATTEGWVWIAPRAFAEGSSVLIAAILISAKDRSGDFAPLRTVVTFFVAAAVAAGGIALVRLCEVLIAAPSETAALAVAGRIFVANLTAILCFSPILMFYDFAPTRVLRWPLISYETVMQIAALGAIVWEVFGRFANAEVHFFYVLFLPLAWITTRHGQRGAAIALAFVFLSAVVSDWLLIHTLRAGTELQLRLIVLAVTALLLGTMVSERRLSQEQVQAQQTELTHLQRLNIGSEMASALAHELSQPLTAAMNYTLAALRMIKAPDPDLERAAEVLSKGISQVEAAGQTVHGLREFMQKSELRLSLSHMDETVERAFHLVSAEADAAHIDLRAVGLSALPLVYVDQVRIVQVLVNLLRNAVQAISEAKMASGAITVSGMDKGDLIEISVADTGPGIVAEVMERLFLPFVSTKASGMGLGLAISKSILESHEGDLQAVALPQGACFKLTLPRSSAEIRDA